mgnify:CR=1 FL=1
MQVLEDVCGGAANRHEGDATEGPAVVVARECAEELLDGGEREEAFVAALVAWAADGGARAGDPEALADAVCHPAPCGDGAGAGAGAGRRRKKRRRKQG